MFTRDSTDSSKESTPVNMKLANINNNMFIKKAPITKIDRIRLSTGRRSFT